MSIHKVQRTLEALQAEFATLQLLLKTCPCRYARLADLPMTDLANPFPSILSISEIPGSNNSLRDTAGQLWSDLSYVSSAQENKNTRRTAGLIVLEADSESQIQLTFQCYVINRLKRQLRDDMSAIPEDKRRQIRVGDHRRINLIQAYRRIAVFARYVNRFSFGWAKNSSTIYNTTVSTFKHHLTLTAASAKFSNEERAEALRDIRVLDTYPEGPLVRRRRIPPTPIVSVTVLTDNKPTYFKRAASSPLLSFIEPGQALPKTTSLEDYQFDPTSNIRPDYKYIPVLPHRDVFIAQDVRNSTKQRSQKKQQRNNWLNRV